MCSNVQRAWSTRGFTYHDLIKRGHDMLDNVERIKIANSFIGAVVRPRPSQCGILLISKMESSSKWLKYR